MGYVTDKFEYDISRQLRALAIAYPGTTEGASCVNRAFKAGGKKNFLFVGEKGDRCRLMLKLAGSVDEARALAQSGPGEVSVGDNGWVTALFEPADHPDLEVLARWVDESFRLLAPKKVLAEIDD